MNSHYCTKLKASLKTSLKVTAASAVLFLLLLGCEKSTLDNQIKAEIPPPAVAQQATINKVQWELGKKLFFSPVYENSTYSCASCHHPLMGGSSEPNGTQLTRSYKTPSIFNMPVADKSAWLTHFQNQGQQASYSRLFKENLNAAHPALSTYLKTLVFNDSPWQRYMAGDKSLLTDQEKRGALLFHGKEHHCASCHNQQRTLADILLSAYQSADVDVISDKISRHKNDAAKSLSQREIADLAAYLKSWQDPCATSADCMAKWLPSSAASTDYPIFTLPADTHKPKPVSFINATAQAGIKKEPSFFILVEVGGEITTGLSPKGYNDLLDRTIYGGISTADIDLDGDLDVYVVRGDAGSNRLYMNQGEGRFVDKSSEYKVGFSGQGHIAPYLVDFTGDGWPDLYLGGLYKTSNLLLENIQGKYFQPIENNAGITADIKLELAAFADYDKDGDLDLYASQWNRSNRKNDSLLWENRGDGYFSPASEKTKLANYQNFAGHFFTPNFSDINRDGWPDLLVTGDFDTSQVFLNQQGKHFKEITNPFVIDDENAMGATVADFDNDGDFDWFVSSVHDPNQRLEKDGSWGISGNRLYVNLGQGEFANQTHKAGVAKGFWAWAACFADFNNDGWLDIYQNNGFGLSMLKHHSSEQPLKSYILGKDFFYDPARLFINQGDGTFVERAVVSGINDTRQGRGAICFDYDNDGDIDILNENYAEGLTLYKNTLQEKADKDTNYLTVELTCAHKNNKAAGATIEIWHAGKYQIREIRYGNNFLSNNPPIAHFGLADSQRVDRLRVVWPYENAVTELKNIKANQKITVRLQ